MRNPNLTSPPALAYIETPFLSVTAVVADAVLKAEVVRLLGFEPTGAETIVIRLAANAIADPEAALENAKRVAASLGTKAITASIARPEAGQLHLNDNPNSINPLYGGRDELPPADFPKNRPMNTNQAIGILETQGLTAILHATDAMLKAANVELVGKEKIGAAYVTIIIRGDVAAVKAALDVGSQAIGDLGKLIAAHVIARPHEGLLAEPVVSEHVFFPNQQLAKSLVAAQTPRVAQTRPAAAKAKHQLRDDGLGGKTPALVLAWIQKRAAPDALPEPELLGQRIDDELAAVSRGTARVFENLVDVAGLFGENGGRGSITP